MKTLMVTFLMLAMLTALAIATPYQDKPILTRHRDNDTTTSSTSVTETESQQTTSSLRGTSRFLASQRRLAAAMTCDKYPKVCRAKGSAGPDCCKKKCVDTSYDRLNCGKCGKKCKFSEICCKGKCVNPRSDKRNCGGCNNKCKKGSSCSFGMCSYA
ncbi:hypothetical protein L484_014177 [Morus notabilis]|uniref:Stigma-specific STIG1-like protein 1 n=1 Tax=Morus notabilis TaxID=981085 RepID=W9R9E7_9ROSA|nr:stigma-specific STIG1-like protein 3 [Morus notabilis]EXB77050.1 hypothetical protein L484_014177 [Morus notabilis]